MNTVVFELKVLFRIDPNFLREATYSSRAYETTLQWSLELGNNAKDEILGFLSGGQGDCEVQG